MSSIDNPIMHEVRRIRDEYAAPFDYDLRRIYEDLRRQQEESGVKTVMRPPRPAQPIKSKPDQAA
jgi:hypothetical protein